MQVDGRKASKFYTSRDIKIKVEELGKKITKDYTGKNLLVLSLLNGAFVFTADLVREINLPLTIEFMRTSSYGDAEESSRVLKILYVPDVDFSEYDVLIVDDILDTGHTMKGVVEYISKLNPKSLKSCVFLDKPERREAEVESDYVGYVIPNNFIVGYGLNLGRYYRNLPDIYALE